MTDRVMTYDAGKLRFCWNIVSRQIEVYEMDGERPVARVGWLLAEKDGHVIEFEEGPFHDLCNEFLEMAATAEIRDETEEPSGDEG
jgi:hypothetical protein